MITMKHREDWSPTGFVARFSLTKPQEGVNESESAIITWGANGEPLVGVYARPNGTLTEDSTLTDASRIPNFTGIDSTLYRGAPIAAQPGWSVEITHPDETTETRPVLAWIQMGPEASPMVPGTGEYEGSIVYVGQDHDEPSHNFDTKLIPPAN